MRYAIEVVAQGKAGQDRAAVFERPGAHVVVLADGAGGSGDGAVAAQAVISAVYRGANLAKLELPGETTAVFMTVTPAGIDGASVGDSGAWLVRATSISDLTEAQHRKPLLGAGAELIRFRSGPLGEATLLVASDGLLKYAHPADIARIARGPDLAIAARELVELVRLPTGGLQDDVAIILCRD